jgi:hypothetical protein
VVSVVAVHHQDGPQPVGFQALKDVVNIIGERLSAQRQSSRAGHVIRSITQRTRRGHGDLGVQLHGRQLGDEGRTSGITD